MKDKFCECNKCESARILRAKRKGFDSWEEWRNSSIYGKRKKYNPYLRKLAKMNFPKKTQKAMIFDGNLLDERMKELESKNKEVDTMGRLSKNSKRMRKAWKTRRKRYGSTGMKRAIITSEGTINVDLLGDTDTKTEIWTGPWGIASLKPDIMDFIKKCDTVEEVKFLIDLAEK